MLYKKEGFPEENELVFCTITKIQYHSVFAVLEFYNKQGMIHISEVSPGRIRNIRDYVKEGKKVVCKVLRINKEKGHIDLSLRRVTDSQKRIVTDSIKQEQKAEKLIELLAKNTKKDFKQLYEKISKPVFQEYDYIFEAFMEVVEHDASLEELGIPKELAKPLTEIVKDKIKPKEYELGGTLKLQSFESDGVDKVSKALKEGEKVDERIQIRYLGAGSWSMKLTCQDAKEGDKSLTKSVEAIEKFITKANGTCEFKRIET